MNGNLEGLLSVICFRHGMDQCVQQNVGLRETLAVGVGEKDRL